MRSAQITKPMISLDVLGKMVRSLSTEQLANLPLEKLPENVPEFFYNIAPEKSKVIEALLIQRDSERMNRQVTDLETYGKEIADAFQVAESPKLPPLVVEFAREVHELGTLVEKSEDLATDEKVGAKFKSLNDLLSRVSSSPLLSAERVLQKFLDSNAEAPAKRIERAIGRVDAKLQPAVMALSRYHELRVQFAHRQMSALRKRIKKEATQQELLQEQIDELNNELQSQRSMWSRALGKYHSSAGYNETQEQIKQLIARKQMSEVPIDDQTLVEWLDAVVDASLADSEQQGVRASRVLLLSLLELYCRQQEESALQIAKNPFTQIDPKQAIKFILASEQFILDYFAKKQEQGSALFRSTAASRRERLDLIMSGLIKELKRNLRRLKM